MFALLFALLRPRVWKLKVSGAIALSLAYWLGFLQDYGTSSFRWMDFWLLFTAGLVIVCTALPYLGDDDSLVQHKLSREGFTLLFAAVFAVWFLVLGLAIFMGVDFQVAAVFGLTIVVLSVLAYLLISVGVDGVSKCWRQAMYNRRVRQERQAKLAAQRRIQLAR